MDNIVQVNPDLYINIAEAVKIKAQGSMDAVTNDSPEMPFWRLFWLLSSHEQFARPHHIVIYSRPGFLCANSFYFGFHEKQKLDKVPSPCYPRLCPLRPP